MKDGNENNNEMTVMLSLDDYILREKYNDRILTAEEQRESFFSWLEELKSISKEAFELADNNKDFYFNIFVSNIED